jgi:hypothetical protein
MTANVQVRRRVASGSHTQPEISSTPTPAAIDRDMVRQSDDQPVLSIRTSVPTEQAAATIAEALRDIRSYLEEHHETPTGPPFSICHAQEDAVDIEAGWPTVRPLGGSGRIHSGLLPRSLARIARGEFEGPQV